MKCDSEKFNYVEKSRALFRTKKPLIGFIDNFD